MSEDYSITLLQHDADGFYGFPCRAVRDRSFLAGFSEPYHLWVSVFDRATRGDFRSLADLVDIYKNCDDAKLGLLCCDLLGDAGTAATSDRCHDR